MPEFFTFLSLHNTRQISVRSQPEITINWGIISSQYEFGQDSTREDEVECLPKIDKLKD